MTNLAHLHNEITFATGAAEDSNTHSHDAGEQYDWSADLAIDLLVAAGYGMDDPDTLDTPVSETVQTLLTLAMHLAPNLATHVDMLINP